MRITELLVEKTIKAPTHSQCSVGHSRLSNVRYAQCVSRGYIAHDTDHTDGSGTQGKKGSGKHLRGKKVKTSPNGPVKNYGGDHS